MISRLTLALFCASMMVGASLLSSERSIASQSEIDLPNLDMLLPERFGPWERVELADIILPPDTDLLPDTETIYRGYRDTNGRIVTLVVAYSETASDSLRLHIPENCYVAQGFVVADKQTTKMVLSDQNVDVVMMSAERGMYREAVSYWLRDGSVFVTAPYQLQLGLLKKGQKHEGKALVRASTPFTVAPPYNLLEEFFQDLDKALDSEAKRYLLGRG